MKTNKPAETAFALLDIEKTLSEFKKMRREWDKNKNKYLKEAINNIKDKKIKINVVKNIGNFQQGRTAEQIAKLVNINSHYIYDAKTIMTQEPKLKNYIISKQICLTDSKKILMLPNDLKYKMLEKIYTGENKKEIRALLFTLYRPNIKRKKHKIKWDHLKAEINSDIPSSQKQYLIGKAYNECKTSYGGDRRSSKFTPAKTKSHEMAEILCISCAVIGRAGKIAKQIDKIKKYNPAVAEKILSGKVKKPLETLAKIKDDIELIKYINEVLSKYP